VPTAWESRGGRAGGGANGLCACARLQEEAGKAGSCWARVACWWLGAWGVSGGDLFLGVETDGVRQLQLRECVFQSGFYEARLLPYR
jgi:hypothetical protein